MSTEVDGTYSVYNEVFRKARVEHRCGACHERIPVGHLYCNIAAIYDGSASTIKRCLRCQRIHEHLRAIADPFDMIWPDERLDCGAEYWDHWGKHPPPEIAALAFVTAEELQTRGAPAPAVRADAPTPDHADRSRLMRFRPDGEPV